MGRERPLESPRIWVVVKLAAKGRCLAINSRSARYSERLKSAISVSLEPPYLRISVTQRGHWAKTQQI